MIVYKYQICSANDPIKMPIGAKIVHIGYQGEGHKTLCIWAEVPSEKVASEVRKFRVVGTGQHFECQEKGKKYVHLQTVFQRSFVWHVYEMVESGND